MRIVLKIGKYLFISLIILCIFAIITINYFKHVTSTARQGTQTLLGLQGTVTVTRDQWGVPHILASKTDQDAFFALGYVHAQDRFWQMEYQRRIVQGRLSEIFGPVTLTQDKFLRSWGFYDAAIKSWSAYNKETQTLIESYTAGVNAFLQQQVLPIEFKLLGYKPEPWTNIDSIAWSKMMAFDLQHGWEQKITRFQIATTLGKQQIKTLLPDYPQNAPTILSQQDLIDSDINGPNIHQHIQQLHQHAKTKIRKQLQQIKSVGNEILQRFSNTATPSKESNSWVIDGTLSYSGKPLLANDPHLGLQAPSLWYLTELRGPHIHVTGATMPGLPAVIIGHNDNIAWGFTNADPDTQDLYIEPQNTKLTVRHETIKVKGQADVGYDVFSSQHGPIISQVLDTDVVNKLAQQNKTSATKAAANHVRSINAKPSFNSATQSSSQKPTVLIAIKWTALMPDDTTIQSIIKLDYARNWQEFLTALQDYVTPSQNTIYADTAGNIGYYLPGKIPIRQGYNGHLPVLSNQHLEWKGYIPFDKLPHVLNPKEHMIVTANNKTCPENYPYHLALRYGEPPYRAERIKALLHRYKKYTNINFEVIQQDVKSLLWEALKPYLLATKPQNSLSQFALIKLRNWNGMTDQHSVAATIFAAWFRELSSMPVAKLGFVKTWREPLFIKQQLASNGPYCKINGATDCQTFLSQSLARAVEKLHQTYGSPTFSWYWGNIHHAVFTGLGFGHSKWLGKIWNRSIKTPGDYYTINVGTYNEDTFIQNKGPGYRQIIDLNDFNQSQYMIAPGQSGNIFDTHYADLLKLWQLGNYLIIGDNSKLTSIKEKLVLRPKQQSIPKKYQEKK